MNFKSPSHASLFTLVQRVVNVLSFLLGATLPLMATMFRTQRSTAGFLALVGTIGAISPIIWWRYGPKSYFRRYRRPSPLITSPSNLCCGIGLMSLSILGYFYATFDTYYAQQYNENTFQSVIHGQTESEVRQLLGPPLDETILEPWSAWVYTEQEQPDFAAYGKASIGSYTVFQFDRHDRAVKIWGQENQDTVVPANYLQLTEAEITRLQGVPKSAIEARYGKPSDTHSHKNTIRILRYSHAPANKHYYQRDIHINEDHIVIDIVHKIAWQ